MHGLLILLSICYLHELFSFSITDEQIGKIAQKIWINECGGTIAGLTHWNKGENFPSLGIGHFIWYPVGKKELFDETFPKLLQFLQSKGETLPTWMKNTSGCPWNTRDAFYQDFQSPQMVQLRTLLAATKDLQAQFIATRLEEALPQMLEHLPADERARVRILFDRLMNDPRGLYALIDYLNFKGAGTLSSERYKGEGWGLLQVLQKISPSSLDLVADFAECAKIVLIQRVENSPPEKEEKKWLNGWLNRVQTYVKNI